MTIKTAVNGLVGLALMTSLAGCMGSSLDEVAPTVSPIAGMDSDVLAQKTNTRSGEARDVDHVVMLDVNAAGISTPPARITFSGASEDPYVLVGLDENGNGIYGEPNAEGYLYREVNSEEQNFAQRDRFGNLTGEPGLVTSTDTINGQEVTRVDIEPNPGRRGVIYVPKNEASETYAGGFALRPEEGEWVHGVFGRRTSATEVSTLTTQGGSATYKGIAFASVEARSGDINDMRETGTYEGTASATVDFATNGYTTNGTVSREREWNDGTDTVTFTGQGSFDANGNMSGTMAFSGLTDDDSDMNGIMGGSLYGPNGETIGATFGANNDNVDNGSIAGSMILNQD